MIRLKCPLYDYGRGNKIRCANITKIETIYKSKDSADNQRKNYCMTMEYEDCTIYKKLVKEK